MSLDSTKSHALAGFHAVTLGAPREAKWFVLFCAVLVIAFCKPLYDLILFCLGSELHSHGILVPFISLYLVWLRMSKRNAPSPQPSSPVGARVSDGTALTPPSPTARARVTERRAATGVFWILGLAALGAYWMLTRRYGSLPINDYLALVISSFLCFLVGGALFFFNTATLKLFAFPLAFLVFMVPFPTIFIHGTEVFLQHASADATALWFKCTSIPVLRDGLVFHLPGFSLRIAEECSGIRSTLVLLMTSLIAGYLFLNNPWNRAWFVLATIPLGILRNGFRVMVISMLCVHVDPSMINSPIHRRGGPLFFVLSLIPLVVLLVLLRKAESRKGKAES